MAEQFDPFAGSPSPSAGARQFDPFAGPPNGPTPENMHEHIKRAIVEPPSSLDEAFDSPEELAEKYRKFKEENSRRNWFGARLPNDVDPENPWLSSRNPNRLLNTIKEAGGSEALDQLKAGLFLNSPEEMRKRAAEGHTPTWDLIAGLSGLGYAGVAGTLHHLFAEPAEYATGIPANRFDALPDYLAPEKSIPGKMARFIPNTRAPWTGLGSSAQWGRRDAFFSRMGEVSPLEAVAHPERAPLPRQSPSDLDPDALRRIAGGQEFGVDIPVENARGNTDAIAFREMAAREGAPYGKGANEIAKAAKQRIADQVAASGQVLSARGAGDYVPTVSSAESADIVNSEIANRAAEERAGVSRAEAEAERASNEARENVNRSGEALERGVRTNEAGQEFPAVENIKQAGGIVSADAKKAARRAARRPEGDDGEPGFKDLYDEADRLAQGSQFEGGTFGAKEGAGFGRQLADSLRHEASIENNAQTPNAYSAVQKLDSNRHLRFKADEEGNPLPVDLQDVLQARKDLQVLYRQARSDPRLPTDQRAMQLLIEAFDDHVDGAIANGLFSGDQRVFDVLSQANAQFKQYARLFRPQSARDPVGTAIRQIVDFHATPEMVANMITDMSSLMSREVPVKIMSRLRDILGADSEAFNAVKQAVLLRTRAVDRAGNLDAIKTAGNMERLADSSLGEAHFSPDQLRAIRDQARGMKDLEQTISGLPEVRRAVNARGAYEDEFEPSIGGRQQTVFRRMVAGDATPEETSRVIFNAITNNSPGDVNRMISAVEKISGGRESLSMAAIRQGTLQHLTEGKSPEKRAEALREFMTGAGETVARRLFPDAADRAGIMRYIKAMEDASVPPEARVTSPTAPLLMSAARHYGAVAFGAGASSPHYILGALGRWAASHTIGAIRDIRAAGRVEREAAILDRRLPSPPEEASPPAPRVDFRSAGMVPQSGLPPRPQGPRPAPPEPRLKEWESQRASEARDQYGKGLISAEEARRRGLNISPPSAPKAPADDMKARMDEIAEMIKKLGG